MFEYKALFGVIDDRGLVFYFCFQKFAIQSCDVADGYIFGTLLFASSGIGAVPETELVHFGDHRFGCGM